MLKNFLYQLPLFCILWSLCCATAPRAEESNREHQLKAAFLVNFAKFITWPDTAFASDEEHFTICVTGNDSLAAALTGAEGKKIGNRSIRVLQAPSREDYPACQMVFIGNASEDHLPSALRTWGLPVVTVSDSPGFAQAGGSIELVTRDDRLSFVINHNAMKEQGMQASASLLNLAAAVH